MIGQLKLAKKVYKNYPMSRLLIKVILCDLAELDMVDFDVIFGIYWLHASYASIDYRTHRVKFQSSSEPILEWKGTNSLFKSKFILYLKAQK